MLIPEWVRVRGLERGFGGEVGVGWGFSLLMAGRRGFGCTPVFRSVGGVRRWVGLDGRRCSSVDLWRRAVCSCVFAWMWMWGGRGVDGLDGSGIVCVGCGAYCIWIGT